MEYTTGWWRGGEAEEKESEEEEESELKVEEEELEEEEEGRDRVASVYCSQIHRFIAKVVRSCMSVSWNTTRKKDCICLSIVENELHHLLRLTEGQRSGWNLPVVSMLSWHQTIPRIARLYFL